ncbi:MAG: hypothetical protein U0872_12520 [Planctomycetaceae bacterium]
MPEYRAAVDLPCLRRDVFDFVSRPANLVNLLASSVSNFEYRLPEKLEVGSRLQFCLHRFGMKIELVHEVVELVDLERITLNQRQGPFRHWFHEYSFSDPGTGQTRLTERVHFERPGGMLGLMVTNAKLLEQLNKYIPRGHLLLREQLTSSAG